MEIEIKKNIKELIGVNLLFEDEKGELFEGEVMEVREGAIKIARNTAHTKWFKEDKIKVVDILNCERR